MNISDFMRADHKRLDAIFKNFDAVKKGDIQKAVSFFHEFKIGLQRHIVWEEEVLFPLFEEKTGLKEECPTEVMRSEHREIRDWLEKIHDNIRRISEGGAEANRFKQGLVETLSKHNDKEENIFYPMLSQSLNEEETKLAFSKMENIPPERYNKCCE